MLVSFTAGADEDTTWSKGSFTLINPTPVDQLRAMDVDRPNVTNSPHTIDAGHLQVETGFLDYTLQRYRADSTAYRKKAFAFGETNFRLGLLNNLEVNLSFTAYQHQETRDLEHHRSTIDEGFGDTILGTKLNLIGNDESDKDWSFAAAVQPLMKFPTGGDHGGVGRFEAQFAFPFSLKLPADFQLGYQPVASFQRNSKNDGDTTGFGNSICVDRELFEKLDIYIEYANFVTTESHQKAEQSIDFGGEYSFTENVVVDCGTAFGLNNATPKFEILLGLSFRL